MDIHQTSDMGWRKPPLVIWAESFIFAGASALLLLIANLFPEYWYFSFFALTPFLYRIIKASCGERSRTMPGESFRLGFLFGLSFFGVSLLDSPLGTPLPSLLKLLLGTGLFAIFGWTVGWARKRWGFYPSVVALLWVGLEIGLLKLGFIQGLLGKAESPPLQAGFSTHPFFHGLVGLFGFLTVSAIIVLLNSLLALAIVKTLEIIKPRGHTVKQEERTWEVCSVPGLFAQRVYLVPEGRAPPFITTGVSSFSLTNCLV